jgi:hypothetical protein
MRVLRFISVTIVLAAITPAAVIAQAGDSERLLREDYVLAGIDGKISEGKAATSFEFETDISDGRATLKAGEAIELLKSATLEKMVEDAKERSEARYRLWGKITKYEGKNFIFPTYFLALRKLERPAEQQSGAKETGQTINAPNDILTIPDEIVKELQTSEILPAVETQQAQLQLKQDTIFANRTGRVIEKEGRFLFEPDGLGRGIGKFEIELLPCEALEKAIDEIRSESNPVRFNVAGILTVYKGRQYLLLQKATRIYSYGNFGR